MNIFNNTSAEIKTKSADVLLKMIIILKERRIAQLCSQNEWTLSILAKLLITHIYYWEKLKRLVDLTTSCQVMIDPFSYSFP